MQTIVVVLNLVIIDGITADVKFTDKDDIGS